MTLMASTSTKSVTTAPLELKASKEPTIVASAILSSTSSTSIVEIIFFLTFLDRPLRIKATLSLVLQKTPTLGFSLKSVNRNRDFSSFMEIHHPFETCI